MEGQIRPAGLMFATCALNYPAQKTYTQRSLLYKTTSCITNKIKKLHRVGWGAMRACRALSEFSWVSDADEYIVYAPPHLHRVGVGCIQVLWPTCKITAVHSQPHCLSPLSLNKGSRNNRVSSCPPGLPAGSCSSQNASAQVPKYLLITQVFSKTTWHIVYTEVSST